MRIHELKIWSAPFTAVLDERKTFEIREDDRGFSTGDVLHLREFLPASGRYTGRWVLALVGYVYEETSRGYSGVLPDGFVAMSIKRLAYGHEPRARGEEG